VARALSTAVVVLVFCLPAFAGEVEAPDFYVGVGYRWDFANDDSRVAISLAGAGTRQVAPVLGLYDNKLLLGVGYMCLGTRAELDRAIYGGPMVFWYDDHIGGGVVLGRHLSREVIIEASYRATSDWAGGADLSVAYGLDWPW